MDEQIKRVAKMMAAAYWRGRLHGVGDDRDLEPMIAAAAERDEAGWVAAANYAVTGIPPAPMCPQPNPPLAGRAGSAQLVDCNAYGNELVAYATISEALVDNRIVSVTKQSDGRFEVLERCDEHYSCFLTGEQLLAWADELRALAGAPNSGMSNPPRESDCPTQ